MDAICYDDQVQEPFASLHDKGADLPHVAKKEEHHEGALKRKAVGADNGPLE